MRLSKSYIFSLDVARAIAIIGVVVIHVYFPIYSRPDFLGGLSWWLAYGLNSLARMGVPLFLMVSSSLLLPRKPKEEIKDTLSRAFYRIGLPLVFWFLIDIKWFDFFQGRETHFYEIKEMFFRGTGSHLYFLVILFNLYLFLPLWRVWQRKSSETGKRYLIGLSLTMGMIIYALKFFVFKSADLFNFFTLWVAYIGYFLAGDYIFQLKVLKKGLTRAKWAFLGAGGFTLGMGYLNLKWLSEGYLSFWGVGGVEYFTNFLSPNIILMSLAGFLLIVKNQSCLIREKNKTYVGIIQSVAKAAMGIYLIHLMVIDWLNRRGGLGIEELKGSLWVYGLKKLVVVFLISWLITAIAIKLPLIKWLFGEKKR